MTKESTVTAQRTGYPVQNEMPFAVVQGEPINELPKDLYIPPDALEVFLAEAFEGPLDLLLYLIRRQNLDILDIPVADITRQYMAYIGMMEVISFELAADYMLMAAMLAEIKSRMLLPRIRTDEEGEEADPRAELVRRLQEYERYKQAAENIDALPRMMRDTFQPVIEVADRVVVRKLPDVSLDSLLKAFAGVMKRASVNQSHHVKMDVLSVRERMSNILGGLSHERFTAFQSLFNREEGRQGAIVSFLAILELMKESLIVIQQADLYADIYVKSCHT